MLKNIYIKDFAIIDELRIEFDNGFMVFTGETGAGKSIIVGAMNFLKGARSDISYIRKGATKAIIEGVFELDERIKNILDENEIEYEDELIVYRTLSIDSKNTIRVNNRTVSLNLLNDILKENIDIHSQKDSNILLNSQYHLSMLDKYMNDNKLIEDTKNAYLKYAKLDKEYQEYLNTNDSINDIEYYRYQIKEIEDADLKIDEEEKLEEISKKSKNAKKYLDNLTNILELYEGNDGIDERLYRAIKDLDFDDEFKDIHDGLLEKYYEIEEYFTSLKKYMKTINLSEEEINNVEERLYTIARLKRKYQASVSDILKLKDDLRNRIEAFDNRNEFIKDYELRILNAFNEFKEFASKLSIKRKKAAQELSKCVIEETDGLELKYFDFKINFIESKPSQKGIDEVEFLISTNKGEDLKPLNKVASGGEMSRINLAIKTVFLKLSNVSLLILDEIDTGVSGKAATAIGLKIAKIAKDIQVIVISHLAQVASFADNHYFVAKHEINDRITSSIKLLNNDERIKELAMISLSSNDDAALNVAADLLKKANGFKDTL